LSDMGTPLDASYTSTGPASEGRAMLGRTEKIGLAPRDRDVVDAERTRRAREGSLAGNREEDADVVPVPLASHGCSFSHTQVCGEI
jgi:hypothetical protein